MKIIGVIPARGGSSRFFEKPLALIAGKPMLFWVYKHCKEVSVFDDVFVAACCSASFLVFSLGYSLHI